MQRIRNHPQLFITALVIILCICFFIAINVGSIKASPMALFKGLFIEYDADIASIYQIRFPRILIAILVGAGLSLSGLLLQVVLKNPLADPGIIGISSGASLVSTCIMIWFPQLYFLGPIFAFIGGLLTFFLIYVLSWKSGLNTTRILLIGVAINYTFTALLTFLDTFSASLTSTVTGQLTFSTWSDVTPLAIYLIPIIVISLCLYKACDLLKLDDKTLLSLGVPITRYRLILSLVAILLCSICVAVVGVIGFVGLIIPHMARIFVGNQYRNVLPISMLMGSIVVLIADTLGRIVIAPYEISLSIMMAIIGGPLFILLLKRGVQHD